ncbi:helix-hairpin-helix domain-containing protein [Streptomyces sp. NPDC088725]|uniref:helix-hairpin-helix domain-containing protein n=1 Tax=Streptomyces sp. NPDC088725 TaxID=3365873 RepID=UPI0038050797
MPPSLRPAGRIEPADPVGPEASHEQGALVGPYVADDAPGGRRERVLTALRERLPMWVQLRYGLEPKTLGALAVVLVVAVILAAQHFWTARPQSVGVPETVREEPVGLGRSVVPGHSPKSVPEPEPDGVLPSPEGLPGVVGGARIVVDVSGKVGRPGVLRLPAGSRVADALRAAGGVSAGADITGLNRARVLTDGEQVLVGVPVPAGAAAGVADGGGGGGGAGPPGPVGLNSATAEQLETLPGVGPVLARHIMDYRAENGGFRSVDQLREVSGIGDRRFADLRPLVRP